MRAAIWVKGSMLVAGLCFVGLPAIAHPQDNQSANQSSSAQQASGQEQTGDSVADAARKAREQQKATPKPKKVYTDDDIAPKPAPVEATATPANKDNAAQASTDTVQGADADDSTKGVDDAEKNWKKRFADQRGKIATAEKELDILQREENKAQVQYYSDPTQAMNEQFSRKDINEKDAKIEAKKKEIDDLKQQLSDMEDELRRSGGDPGWARE